MASELKRRGEVGHKWGLGVPALGLADIGAAAFEDKNWLDEFRDVAARCEPSHALPTTHLSPTPEYETSTSIAFPFLSHKQGVVHELIGDPVCSA